jgi:hypothetical protein
MLTYERNGRIYESDPNTLPAASLAYLLQYGWAQSLQDCIAGRAKKVREEMDAQNVAGTHSWSDDEIAEAVEVDLDAMLAKRSAAIIQGTMGARESVARDPFETACNRIASEMLAAHLKANKVSLKRDSDKWKELHAQVRVKYAEKIEAEAKRRLESADTISIDL